MLNAVWEFFKSNFPQVSGYFIIIVITAWFVAKATLFYKETKDVCNNHDEIKNKLDLLINKFNSLIITLSEKNAIKDSKK